MKHCPKQDAQGWIDLAHKQIERIRGRIISGETPQAKWQGASTSYAGWYADLGRARLLHGDPIAEVRAAFQEAARHIMKSFKMAYDEKDPDYLGDKTNYARVSETYAIEGMNYALMSSDFALAKQVAFWVRQPGDGVPMDEEVNDFTFALKHYLEKEKTLAFQLVRRTVRKYQNKTPAEAYQLNYLILSTTLLGILEHNEGRFNEGLKALLTEYKDDAEGENEGTSE